MKPFAHRLALFCSLAFAVAPARADELTIGFWNVENLFDEFKDEGHRDAEVLKKQEVFLKLSHRAQVIKDLNADILGLAEVENRDILRRLCDEHLKEQGYRYIVLLDEKDPRGIDVAMISKRPFLAQTFDVPGFYRGILACRFTVAGEPFYVLVNHWKSRRETADNPSAPARLACSEKVQELTEKILPEIEGKPVGTMVIGDLNDDDDDVSVARLEKAGFKNTFRGTPKEKRWSLPFDDRKNNRVVYNGFDHILVGAPLLAGKPLAWVEGSSEVFRPPYMLRKRKIGDKDYDWPDDDYVRRGGEQHIGYADHFPVRARFRHGKQGAPGRN